MPVCADLAELNQWLEDRCIALWTEAPHKVLPGSIADVWEAEKPTLMALPPAFDGFIEHSKRVSPTCLITFERNRYSVPASYANRRVSLHVYPERLIVVAEGQTVCEHARIIERSHRRPGKVIYDWRHYLAVIQRKPGALRNGAPFTEMPDAFRQLQDHMLRKEGGDREMVDILSLVLQHNEEDVLCAVKAKLIGISKHGNRYLRKLFIHEARTVLHLVRDRTSPITAWADALKERAHVNVAAVAMANKMARIAWAVLTKGERYRPNAMSGL